MVVALAESVDGRRLSRRLTPRARRGLSLLREVAPPDRPSPGAALEGAPRGYPLPRARRRCASPRAGVLPRRLRQPRGVQALRSSAPRSSPTSASASRSRKPRRFSASGGSSRSSKELDEAFARGEIGWSKVREICRVATPETERAWLLYAKSHNMREIERAVSEEEGRRPAAEGGRARWPANVPQCHLQAHPPTAKLAWETAYAKVSLRVPEREPRSTRF